MMEGDGKCRAEAEARGLPANKDARIRGTHAEKSTREREEVMKDTLLQMERCIKSLVNDRKNITLQLGAIKFKPSSKMFFQENLISS